ncbi:sucrase ferredoxin [Reinekea sp.]|jgi:hypothetical protein|uniref:sucrase ferredoxin n=1 Tax=Reinekea sp. TaxID=1970455 RepID=UPI0039898A4C
MTDFCAQYSRQVNEPLAGTGGHPQSNLLLSWPIGDWTRTFHQAKSMTNVVSKYISDLVGSGRRVNLIDHPDQPKHWHRAYLMPEQRAFKIPTFELEDFLAAFQSAQSLEAWETEPVEHKIVLCCTHGIKDKCCAKFGNASFKALDFAVKKNWLGHFEVWKSSHLGGCRLASAAVVFPAVRKYGRIEANHTVALLECEYQDLPYLPCYRGNGDLTPRQQIADIEARKTLASQGIQPFSMQVTSEHEQEDQTTVEFQWQSDGNQGQVSIKLQPLTISRYGTCSDITSQYEPVTIRTWQAAN